MGKGCSTALAFLFDPVPRLSTSPKQTKEQEGQRPRHTRRPKMIEPDTKQRACDGGDRHRPTDEAEHPQAEPDGGWAFLAGAKLAGLSLSDFFGPSTRRG